MAHPNEELTRKGYEAFDSGDMETLQQLLAEDVSWYVPGNNTISGEYHGRDEVLQLFAQIGQETGGNFRFEIHDVLANDQHSVALVKAHGERNGVSVDGTTQVHVSHIEDGQIVSFWNHPYDADRFDEFWS